MASRGVPAVCETGWFNEFEEQVEEFLIAITLLDVLKAAGIKNVSTSDSYHPEDLTGGFGDDSTVVINILGDGSVKWNKKEMNDSSLKELFEMLAKQTGDKYSLNIRVAKNADWSHVQKVLQIVEKHGKVNSIMISSESNR